MRNDPAQTKYYSELAMIADLLRAGYFREITTEGRKTLVLANPVQVVIKSAVLAELKKAYPLHTETGGVLYAYPDRAGALIVNRWQQLPNGLPADQQKTAYQPTGIGNALTAVVRAGALPILFHSHPLSIAESAYDKQPLLFFQKTSTADRHNSYLPLTIEGYTVVLPNGLLSANDRAGADVRFYLYGGFIAPNSVQALLTNEKVYIYFAIAVVLVAYVFGGFRKSLAVFGLAAVLSIAVFVLEKRPTGVRNADGDLIISIP